MTALLWWMTPEEVEAQPMRLLQQVMVFGLPQHVREAQQRWSKEEFQSALRNAPPGLFDPRSWAYWHALLDMLPAPPLPVRRLPGL